MDQQPHEASQNPLGDEPWVPAASQGEPRNLPARPTPPASSTPPPGPDWPPYGYGQNPYGPHPQVAPKNPGLALLVSFFFPGVGSMMNGDAGKGIGILIGYLVSWFLVIVFVGLLGVLGFWVWGMVDAYRGAQKWNARHGIIS